MCLGMVSWEKSSFPAACPIDALTQLCRTNAPVLQQKVGMALAEETPFSGQEVEALSDLSFVLPMADLHMQPLALLLIPWTLHGAAVPTSHRGQRWKRRPHSHSQI